MERKKLDRALGPYSYPDKFMVTIIPAEITGNKGRQTKSFTFKEHGGQGKAQAAAAVFVANFNEQAQLTAGTTVEEALEGYPVFLAKPKGKGLGNGPRSIQLNMRQVRNVLDDDNKPLQDIDAPYLAEREQARRGTIADATVINEIKATSRFLAYCEGKKLIRFNPLAGYYVAGNRNKGGKGFKQPALDDVPILRAKALDLAEAGDEGALAVAMTLQTGLRVTKLLTRRGRHVDMQGFVLKIPPEGRRVVNKNHPYIMPITDPRLAALLLRQKQECPAPDDYLWRSKARGPHESKSGHRCRNWLADQVRRVCRAAGVSEDTHAHGLRGVMATVGLISGEALDVIRQQLGHGRGSSVTTDAYVPPEAQHLSAQAKAAKVWGQK